MPQRYGPWFILCEPCERDTHRHELHQFFLIKIQCTTRSTTTASRRQSFPRCSCDDVVLQANWKWDQNVEGNSSGQRNGPCNSLTKVKLTAKCLPRCDSFFFSVSRIACRLDVVCRLVVVFVRPAAEFDKLLSLYWSRAFVRALETCKAISASFSLFTIHFV